MRLHKKNTHKKNVSLLLRCPSRTHTHTFRQLPKSEIAKERLHHPWLHFTRRSHRKINCTNWVTEFIKLVFSFSTSIKPSLCESVPEVMLRARWLTSEERQQRHCRARTSAAPTFTAPCPLESRLPLKTAMSTRYFSKKSFWTFPQI